MQHGRKRGWNPSLHFSSSPAKREKGHRLFEVFGFRECDFEIARAEMADLRNITGEAWFERDRLGVHFCEQQDFAGGRPKLDAGEILDALEGDAEAQRRFLHIVAERQKKRF